MELARLKEEVERKKKKKKSEGNQGNWDFRLIMELLDGKGLEPSEGTSIALLSEGEVS